MNRIDRPLQLTAPRAPTLSIRTPNRHQGACSSLPRSLPRSSIAGARCVRILLPQQQQAAMATTSPRALLLLLLLGLCGLVLGFVPSAAPLRSAPASSRICKTSAPQALPTLLLRAAADGSAAEVGAVESCRRKIQDALTPVQLVVKSSNDDPNGSHIALCVVSAAFEGKNRVQRQQLVYKAIWEELAGPIHAVDELVCKTPAEAEEGL